MHSPRLCTLFVHPGCEQRFDPPWRLQRLNARAWLLQPSMQQSFLRSGENFGFAEIDMPPSSLLLSCISIAALVGMPPPDAVPGRVGENPCIGDTIEVRGVII